MSLSRWLMGLALTLVLAGCAVVSAAEAPGNPVIARGAPETEARPAAEAGHLRTVGSRAVTLDPALVRDVGSAGYVLEIFAGLVKLNTGLELAP
ncbi:MAG: hypothetical protein QGG58_05140, partial [Chloroflexota bacterium]|nr:hypothetical protein [Chloroflexota bacterium]